MTKVKKIKCEFTNKDKQKVYILSNILEHVGRLLHVDVYDLHQSNQHFKNWCVAKNYHKRDSQKETNTWFLEYQSDENGMNACPPYVALVDIFAHHCPELFPIEYIPDLEGHERCFDMDYLIDDVKNNPEYALTNKDNLLVQCLEKIKEVYGNEVYMVEQET